MINTPINASSTDVATTQTAPLAESVVETASATPTSTADEEDAFNQALNANKRNDEKVQNLLAKSEKSLTDSALRQADSIQKQDLSAEVKSAQSTPSAQAQSSTNSSSPFSLVGGSRASDNQGAQTNSSTSHGVNISAAVKSAEQAFGAQGQSGSSSDGIRGMDRVGQFPSSPTNYTTSHGENISAAVKTAQQAFGAQGQSGTNSAGTQSQSTAQGLLASQAQNVTQSSTQGGGVNISGNVHLAKDAMEEMNAKLAAMKEQASGDSMQTDEQNVTNQQNQQTAQTQATNVNETQSANSASSSLSSEDVQEIATRILTATKADGSQEVRITLNEKALAGTEVTINKNLDGQLTVQFNTNNANSFQTLVGAQDALKEALMQNNDNVQVEVRSDDNQQDRESRTKQEYSNPDANDK